MKRSLKPEQKLVLTKPLQGEELNGSIAKLQKKFSIKGIVKPVARELHHLSNTPLKTRR